MVVARMMTKFFPMLHQQGAKTVDDIEKIYHKLKRTDVAKELSHDPAGEKPYRAQESL